MDFSELKQKLDRSREVETEVQGVKFRLRLPSEHAWRVATEHNTSDAGKVQQVGVTRELMEQAIGGWEGLKAEHFLKGAGEDVIAFSEAARSVFLDECTDMSDELVLVLWKALNKRRRDVEAARKNSSRASSGTLTGQPAARSLG